MGKICTSKKSKNTFPPKPFWKMTLENKQQRKGMTREPLINRTDSIDSTCRTKIKVSLKWQKYLLFFWLAYIFNNLREK